MPSPLRYVRTLSSLIVMGTRTKEVTPAMTTAPERHEAIDLGIMGDMPVVAKGLASAFAAPRDQLLKLGTLLSSGQVPLTQRVVVLAPYVGHPASRMRVIHKMAAEGNLPARRERAAVNAFHASTRYTPLAGFLAQIPPPWRPLLLTTIHDPVTRIELKAGQDNRVVDVVVWHSRTLHEYGLRAFNLSFSQLQRVAAWIRENEDLLPTHAAHIPPARPDNQRVTAARTAALITFFDNMPEKMRDLMVAKARPELVGIHFETTPTGDVVLRVLQR